MGTNYYLVKNGPTVHEPVHIGKSSGGWKFLFETQNRNSWNYPPVVWNTFNQVKECLRKYTVESNDYVIIDEYDDIISYDDFVKMVERKQKEDADNPDNFKYIRNVDGYRFDDGPFL